jgi:hypothetical protein
LLVGSPLPLLPDSFPDRDYDQRQSRSAAEDAGWQEIAWFDPPDSFRGDHNNGDAYSNADDNDEK